jgi:hypothetical protein
MKFYLITVLMLLAMVLAAPNHQERQIYYSEQDSVCRYGSGYDEIYLAISIDGVPAKRVLGRAATSCRQWGIRYADRIMALPMWSYIEDQDTFLKFD